MHNFSSVVKYLLGIHMKQNLMVKNLGLTFYDKENVQERDLGPRYDGQLGPSYPDQVTVSSLWDVQVQPLNSLNSIL